MYSIMQCNEYRHFFVQAKQAYLKDMSVYGMNVATYHNSQARYTALLAAYNKVSAQIASSCKRHCTFIRELVSS